MPPPNDQGPYRERGLIPQAANEIDLSARDRIWELPVNKLFPKTTLTTDRTRKSHDISPSNPHKSFEAL